LQTRNIHIQGISARHTYIYPIFNISKYYCCYVFISSVFVKLYTNIILEITQISLLMLYIFLVYFTSQYNCKFRNLKPMQLWIFTFRSCSLPDDGYILAGTCSWYYMIIVVFEMNILCIWLYWKHNGDGLHLRLFLIPQHLKCFDKHLRWKLKDRVFSRRNSMVCFNPCSLSKRI
jgi:hypothetical protein